MNPFDMIKFYLLPSLALPLSKFISQDFTNPRGTQGYYDTLNNTLINILNDFEAKPFIQMLPQLPENMIPNIKQYIMKYNKNPDLEPILTKFIQYIDPINLLNLLMNIETLQVKYQKIIERNHAYTILGDYNSHTNTIYIHKKTPFTLSHEFLHAASTKRVGNISLCGFTISNEHGMFFDGLNEGFTELFNERIFNTASTTYRNNITICRCLELIFDNPKDVETAYFNNDIDFFYQTFLEYGTKEEFAYICYQLDCFFDDDYTKQEYNTVLDILYMIISRKNDPEKLEQFRQITQASKPFSIQESLKKIVKKRCARK